jgi:EAL domain-containing protein (putative c-di-GMP-specific phosphodiesterase class I)
VFLGIAHGKAKDAERLLSHAEAALAQGKRQQQHCTLFDPALDAKLKRRQLIAAQLPLAIKSAELTAVYQPIICTHSNRLHGAELLCRWPHPEFGMISPDEFIPLAEELGLIGQLGQLMLELGCAQLARWQVAARIWCSPSTCRRCSSAIPSSARRSSTASRATGSPWQLELEITEGVLMENADEIESNLASLIEAGFQLAIDDFGTGYCSSPTFPGCRWRPSSSSFTQGLATNQATTAIVRSVIGLGHELGIKITAEGVETQEQAWLVQVGCDRLQAICSAAPSPRRVCPQLPAAGAVSQQQQGHPRVALLFLQRVRELAPLLLEVGTPAVVHAVFFEDGQHLGDVATMVSMSSLHSVVASKQKMVAPSSSSISSASVTSKPALNRSTAAFSSRSKSWQAKWCSISYSRSGLLPSASNSLTMAVVFAPLLHIKTHINPRCDCVDIKCPRGRAP